MSDLARYLDSIRSLYPYGIPLSLLRGGKRPDLPRKVPSPVTWGNEKAKLAILVVDSGVSTQPSAPFEGKLGELLKAVITQGLKLDAKKLYLVMADSDSTESAPLSLALKQISSPYLVALGAQAAAAFATDFAFEEMRGKWTTLSDKQELLTTYSLSEIAQDAALKKLFWADLKKVLLKIG